MADLALYAIGIDEVRDIFAANEQLAARLRSAAGQHFAPPRRKTRGLLDKLGPLFRRDPKLEVNPSLPTGIDVDTLLQGRFVAPERLTASWTLFEFWLDELSWGKTQVSLTQAEFDDMEFSLARAGLPSPFALGQLLGNDAQLPLRPKRGSSVGYAKFRQVGSTRQALSHVIEQVDEAQVEPARQILDFLENFPEWTTQAVDVGRPPPDLLVVWDRS